MIWIITIVGSHFNEMAGKVLGMLVFVHELQISIWFKKKIYKKILDVIRVNCFQVMVARSSGASHKWKDL